MPFTTQKLTLAPAKIISSDPENRLVNIKWLNTASGVNNVIVLGSLGNLSFPKVGDTGLVCRYENWAYYLGNIEYGYARRIAGELKEGNKTLWAKLVKDGEIFLTNILQGTFLSLSNGGDISLLNGFSEGIKYFAKYRLFKTTAMTLQFIGNGITSALGSVVRDLPELGPTTRLGDSGGPAVEAFVEVKEKGVKLGRAHLGYVKDTTLGIDELSSFASRIRALLEVTAGPAPMASVKIDEVGNIEVSSTAGNFKQDIGQNIETTSLGGNIKQIASLGIEQTAIGGDYVADGVTVKLGGIGASQSVVLGTSYTLAESAFLDALNAFSSFLDIFFKATALSATDPVLASAAGNMVAPTASLIAAIATFKAEVGTSLSAKTFTS